MDLHSLQPILDPFCSLLSICEPELIDRHWLKFCPSVGGLSAGRYGCGESCINSPSPIFLSFVPNLPSLSVARSLRNFLSINQLQGKSCRKINDRWKGGSNLHSPSIFVWCFQPLVGGPSAVLNIMFPWLAGGGLSVAYLSFWFALWHRSHFPCLPSWGYWQPFISAKFRLAGKRPGCSATRGAHLLSNFSLWPGQSLSPWKFHKGTLLSFTCFLEEFDHLFTFKLEINAVSTKRILNSWIWQRLSQKIGFNFAFDPLNPHYFTGWDFVVASQRQEISYS